MRRNLALTTEGEPDTGHAVELVDRILEAR
jgi:hypothetical protein